MRYLLDTGILVRLPHRSDPEHQSIRDALRQLLGRRHSLVTARQNIVEFWNVCTRPTSARGGFGLSVEETLRRVRLIERFVEVLNEPDTTYRHWKGLVTKYQVIGKQVHDAKIASVMVAYRIKRLLTLNDVDFRRYSEVEAFTPSAVLSS
jgi:predicted nucleic acid-binding protein